VAQKAVEVDASLGALRVQTWAVDEARLWLASLRLVHP
jgi:hypothetical protein